ncbi:MAG: outer membrane protein assembly factor BamB [Proteobacteria bacterium]|nr:outer membrane protein assembly factor BamB [Pseudomonadota bacterium]MDA0896439.1 outer membrane protein assembly factor BamB [Pseudomonadota bacterium]MDA1244698.1 outer membrane protein assembly factor BamB [Pseudomonadota bacterium]
MILITPNLTSGQRNSYHRLAARGLVLLLLSASLTNCAGFDVGRLNPSTWFGDDEVNPPTELTKIDVEVTLKREWDSKIGNGQGKIFNLITPVIDGDRLFVASADGTVAAFSANDGTLLWRERLEDPITGGVGAGYGLVLLGTEAAEVVALDQDSGAILWAMAVSSEVLSAPKTNGDVVVVQTVDEKLVALEATTGEQRWTYETTLPALTLRGTSSPVFATGGKVLAGFSNGTLVAVDARDGVWSWEERVAVPEGQYDIDRVIDIDGQLLVDGSRVLASSYQGNLMALDVNTGRIVWGREASSFHGIERGFGNLYYVDDEGVITAVRDNSEDVVWENSDLKFRSVSAPRAVGNYIAVTDFEGYVHLLSQIDGRIVGRTRADSDGVRAAMMSGAGLLYVYGNSGKLSAYRPD